VLTDWLVVLAQMSEANSNNASNGSNGSNGDSGTMDAKVLLTIPSCRLYSLADQRQLLVEVTTNNYYTYM
jgi:hypothetical protein